MHVPYWQKNQFQLHLPVMCLAALEYTRTVNSLPITCYKKARGRMLGGGGGGGFGVEFVTQDCTKRA